MVVTKETLLIGICSLLKCKAEDINQVEILANGRTNLSLAFSVADQRYVYRHPGTDMIGSINRKAEKFACMQAAELEIDQSCLYMDEETGVKLSKFIQETRSFSFENPEDVTNGIRLLKRLHQAQIQSPFTFDHLDQIAKLRKRTEDRIGQDTQPFVRQNAQKLDTVYQTIVTLDDYVKRDNWLKCLCHGDPKGSNFLVSEEGYTLIDWEYASNKDIGYDISHFAAETGYARCGNRWEISREDVAWYFEGAVTDAQYRHILGCFAIEELYWTVWGVRKEDWSVFERCLENAERFGKLALALYEGKNND